MEKPEDNSAQNQHQLEFLKDISEVSALCATHTYIWGGLTIDILEGRFLREHHDVDGFTLNLLSHKDRLTTLYQERGYTVTFMDAFDFLMIEKDGCHALFNRLELDTDIAMWRHIGNAGTVYFPTAWLSETPINFYDVAVFISGIEFEYAIKTNPQLLSPEWKGRAKDRAAIQYLDKKLRDSYTDPITILHQVWSYNPFWRKKGYQDYALPVLCHAPKDL